MKKWEIDIAHGWLKCDVCGRANEDMNIAKVKYYVKNFASNKRPNKICKTLQKHPHEIWICDKCLSDFRDEWWRTTNDRFKIWQNEKI